MVTLAPPVVVAPHARDLLGWHGLSAAAMAAMLVVTFPAWLAGVAAAVFGVGLVWCAVQAFRLRPRAAYVRLAVCCLAMLAMLVPLAGPQVVAAGHQAGESMAGHPMADGSALSAGPGSLALVLAGVLVCLAVAGVARAVPASSAARSRAAGLAEAVLAGLMAAMLLGAV